MAASDALVAAYASAALKRPLDPGRSRSPPPPPPPQKKPLPRGWRAPAMPPDRTAPSKESVAAVLRERWAAAAGALTAAVQKELSAAVKRRAAEAKAERELVPGAIRKVSYASYVGRFREHVGRLDATYRRLCRPPDIAASYADPAYEIRGISGDDVLQKMLHCAATFADPPTSLQFKIIKRSLEAMAALIYGEEWGVDRDWICERNGWNDLYGVLSVLTPRKFGKTTVLACAKRYSGLSA